MSLITDDQPSVFTVAELNACVQSLLEAHFPAVWVSGEVSNLVAPSSGHLYFSLKDTEAQIRCALFKGRNGGAPTPSLASGMHILVRGEVSLYTPRGDYQLIVREWQLMGQGMLEWQFRELKEKLARKGLFDPAHKKPLPRFPSQIGVVTSPTGAAIQDILNVLNRRMPLIPIRIYPTLVQGKEAAGQIVRAIDAADQEAVVDVLIVARGGGSLEDLWPFNEEKVAEAIHRCRIPLISGVGHEIDFTIADFVADCRAPTPSAAAEMVSPDQQDIRTALLACRQKMTVLMTRLLEKAEKDIDFFKHRLAHSHPGRKIQWQIQKTDELIIRFQKTMRARLEKDEQSLGFLVHRLARHHPLQHVAKHQEKWRSLHGRLEQAMAVMLERRRQEYREKTLMLKALSPFATLERGYAIVQTLTGEVIDTVASAKEAQMLQVQFQDGVVKTTVV